MNGSLSVLVFDTATARDASIPHPHLGQPVFLLSTGDFLLWYGAPVRWAPPWGSSWGEVATAQIADFEGPFADGNWGTDMGLSVTFTPVKNRAYVVALEGVVYNPGVDEVEYLIRHGKTDTSTWARGWYIPPKDGGPFRISRYYREGADPVVGQVPVTFDAAYVSLFIDAAGTGTEPRVPVRLWVTDVGPVGPAPIG